MVFLQFYFTGVVQGLSKHHLQLDVPTDEEFWDENKLVSLRAYVRACVRVRAWVHDNGCRAGILKLVAVQMSYFD